MDTYANMGEALASTPTDALSVPSWLTPSPFEPQPLVEPPTDPDAPRTKEAKELTVIQYELMFDRVLDEIASGCSLIQVIKDDARRLGAAKFMRWVKSDPMRKARYEEAQAIAAEIKMAECVEIADAEDSIEEVARSRLRVDTRMIQIKAYDRGRYGDTKTVEFSGGISITAALSEATQRVMSNVIEDVTDVEALAVAPSRQLPMPDDESDN